MARRASSRLALGATIRPLLPPSSRSVRPSRLPTTSATRLPIRQLPVAEISGKPPVGDHRLARSSAPADAEVEDPRAAVRLGHAVDDVLHGDGRQGRLGRRLPDHRVAADRRQRRVPGPDGDREVERRDDADRPQRVPLLEHPVPRPLAGDRQAVELPRQPDGEVAHVDHLLDFALPLRADLARLERDQQPQVRLALAKRLADLADDLAPARRRHHPPGRERLARLRHDRFVVGRPTPSAPGDAAPRRRVERDELLTAGLLDPIAAAAPLLIARMPSRSSTSSNMAVLRWPRRAIRLPAIRQHPAGRSHPRSGDVSRNGTRAVAQATGRPSSRPRSVALRTPSGEGRPEDLGREVVRQAVDLVFEVAEEGEMPARGPRHAAETSRALSATSATRSRSTRGSRASSECATQSCADSARGMSYTSQAQSAARRRRASSRAGASAGPRRRGGRGRRGR